MNRLAVRRRSFPVLILAGLVCSALALGTNASSAATKKKVSTKKKVAATFTLKVTPATVTLTTGGQSTLFVAVTRSSTFRKGVALELDDLPVGVSVVSSAAVKGGVSVVIGAPTTVSSSVSIVRMVGTGGGLRREAPFTLQVNGRAVLPPPVTPVLPTPPTPPTSVVQSVGEFSLSVDPATTVVPAGAPTRYAVFVNGAGGFNGTVQFRLRGLPTGAQAAFLPEFSKQGTTLLITTGVTTPQGNYALVVDGLEGNRIRSVNLTLSVRTGADFTIGIISQTTTLIPGGTTGITVNVASLTSTTADVNLTFAGLSAGSTVTPITARISQTGFFQVVIPTNAPSAIYRLTVTGTSGSFVKSAFVDLTVQGTASIGISPGGASAPRGSTTTYSLQLAATAGTSAPVLNVSGTPAASSFNIIYNADGSRLLTITTTADTPTGQYTITVTARYGTVDVAATTQLVVT